MTNYDTSLVGVPYVRAHRITIEYPDKGLPPKVIIEQSLAVKMADGSVRQIEDRPALTIELDMGNAMAPFPMVDKETGAPIGVDTNIATVYMQLLAAVRHIQLQFPQE